MSSDPNDLGTASWLGPPLPDHKVEIYREFNNWTLLEVVRRTLPVGGAVLDVGCASGGLLHHLGALASYRVGIEPSAQAAEAARGAAHEVLNRQVDDPELVLPAAAFDVVVCGDVLEHLVDPAPTLERIVPWVKDGGAVVISVPNIANWQARLRLLRGTWRYEDCGIWDDGHLRFFSLKTLQQLIVTSGLTLESVTSTQAALHQLRVLRPLPRRVQVGAERLLAFLARGRPQLFAFQFVAVARKPTQEE